MHWQVKCSVIHPVPHTGQLAAAFHLPFGAKCSCSEQSNFERHFQQLSQFHCSNKLELWNDKLSQMDAKNKRQKVTDVALKIAT